MTNNINFNAAGDPLWVRITAEGLYAISFVYTLFAADADVTAVHKILTNPMQAGNNTDPNPPYCFPVINNYAPGEPLSKYDGRNIDVYFFVKKLAGDDGFVLKAELLQGDDPATAPSLGFFSNDPAKNTVGDGNSFTDFETEFKISQLP